MTLFRNRRSSLWAVLLTVVLSLSPLCFAQAGTAPAAAEGSAQTKATAAPQTSRPVRPGTPARAAAKPTPQEAEKFITDVEQELSKLSIFAAHASWVQATYINYDTEILAADANDKYSAAASKAVEDSKKYAGLNLPYDPARKLKLLQLSLTVPVPSEPKEREELTKLTVALESDFGKGKFCPDTGEVSIAPEAKPGCLTINDMEKIMAESRDPEQLKKIWIGWRKVPPLYRDDYSRFVQLANKGAREMGFKDVGAMWRSNYDMPPDQFAAEMERLWNQVKPLYLQLHAYVRWKLAEKYGKDMVPEDQPIPAQLLGNMWSQEWTDIYDEVKPQNADPGYDLDQIIKQRKLSATDIVKYGEGFFQSLGFGPLPQTFWQRSMLTKPRDRDVVCHASAWDIDNQKDVRLKLCIVGDADDFRTVHHELGHNYYQMAYAPQPFFYQNSANDGFHEAIGDTIALSITPEYLKKINFIQQVPPESADIGLLLNKALEKVAFLPFGYLVDQWRWEVFSGKVTPADYNKSWWELRTKYQGIRPPVARSEQDFDPGSKYHVAANVPYARYFLATILQFQFHRALCRIAGYQGPLHRCSIYGNKEAGQRLEKMLAMGQSRPWPEALKELTGEDQMDATAIMDYFAPLMKWLEEQNRGHKVGW
jgi:peptidyl-dipeptidase A